MSMTLTLILPFMTQRALAHPLGKERRHMGMLKRAEEQLPTFLLNEVVMGCKCEQYPNKGPHLGSVALQAGLELLGGADVPLQDAAIPRACAQHMAAPRHSPHTPLVPSQHAHSAVKPSLSPDVTLGPHPQDCT